MSRLLIVSNRLPVTVRVEHGAPNVSRSAGGLATAMRGPHERLDSLWIGWPGDLSKLAPDVRAAVDEKLRAMRTVPIHLSSLEVSRYYDGFSNGVLWPLFHYLLEKVHLDARRDWEVYQAVNERFADVVAEQYRPGDTVWVHDYQLTLVPRLLRKRIPDARIGFFLHIPFPSSEVFRLLPWREQVLRGLLGADLIGFHTAAYRHGFAFSAARVLGLEPDVDALQYEDRTIRLGIHPIGIDAREFERLAELPNVRADADQIRSMAAGRKIVLGIDRLDYTKGIGRRLLAVERFFERNPEQRSKVRYVQLAVPTREKVEAYAEFRRTVNEMVGRINGAYGTISGVPIHFLHRSVSPEQLTALYRAAHVMLVTPLRDGMNLVAKEYVACRPECDGALILSEFAGAADELGDALLVNPYDIDHVAAALERALTMTPDEQTARMRALRRQVFTQDVHRWAQDFLAALAPGAVARRGEVPPVPAAAAIDRLRAARELVLFLDYDGTLVPIAPTPELAAPDDALRALLRALAARPGVHLHVVSGRSRDDLDRFLGDLPITLHAEHGFWTKLAGAEWVPLRDPSSPWKEEVRPILQSFAERTGGAFVEEKATSLAWHYRLADLELASVRLRELRLALVDVLRAHDLENLPGSKVLEVRPRGIHKGQVVQRALRDVPNDAMILAVGDDRTDEDIFAALPRDAVSIRVGEGPSAATYRVAAPSDVRKILGDLVEPRA